MKENQTSIRQKGQSLVELAVSLPVILLILLGTFDIGMALFSYSIIRDSAQEGALYGSFNPGNKAEIENRARNILPRDQGEVFSSPVDLRNKDSVSIDIITKGAECQGVTKGTANYIQVKITYNYPILFPLIGQLFGSDGIQISSTASNVILQPPCQ
ncbi:MAG TPA: pilus assembly protein [Chitinophagales bacterium]|nr:pilus assembly protein [Chitinophagales bacterium]